LGEAEVALRLLAAELQGEVERIDRTVAEIEQAIGSLRERPFSHLELYGLSALVQSFYTGVERSLDRIAGAFGLRPRGDAWHRRLLDSSSLPVAGVRGAVISTESVARLDPLLAFRHRTRNLYSFELDSQRVVDAAVAAVDAWVGVRAELIGFADALAPAPG
jgi:hypothetical protein